MKHLKNIGMTIIICVLPAATSFAQNPGDGLFNSSEVYRIEFTFSQPNWWDSLKTYHENYLTGSNIKYLMGDVKINSALTNNVGVRLKGSASYYNVIGSGNKVSFKIDFNNYVPGQNFDGLRKLNLNNGYNDPTFMREKISLDFLNKQGIFAPRCTYAEVYINGTYWGFYALTEQIDPTFLNSKFGDNSGNLYKAADGGADLSLNSDPYDDYVLETNEIVNNRSDLIKFIDVINNTSDTQFKDSLEKVLFTDSYISLWAANNLFADFDGYEYAADNYYIYNNSFDNKFYWIARDRNGSFGGGEWDMSVAQKENLSAYYIPDPVFPHPLHYRMLQNAYYSDVYLNTLCDYLQGDFKMNYLYGQIDDLYDRIKPYVYADANKLYTDQQFENNIDFAVSIEPGKELPGLKPFIAARISNVANEIGCLVGVENLTGFGNLSGLRVYPNPSQADNVFISFQLNDNATVELSVIDLYGKQQAIVSESEMTSGVHKLYVETSDLTTGIYIIQLNIDGLSYQRKWVKL